MAPRSFFTNVTNATKVQASAPVPLRGIAFGGDCGVAAVDVSFDAGATWRPATLGEDAGPYSFRRWEATGTADAAGLSAMVRCTNTKRSVQPMQANWNGGGFLRNVIETVHLTTA